MFNVKQKLDTFLINFPFAAHVQVCRSFAFCGQTNAYAQCRNADDFSFAILSAMIKWRIEREEKDTFGACT